MQKKKKGVAGHAAGCYVTVWHKQYLETGKHQLDLSQATSPC